MNKKLREIYIDFMPGRGTVDTMFNLRRLTEKYQSKGKKPYYVFVDLGKVVDRIPQQVVWYGFRKRGLPEYLAQGMLYSRFKTVVSVDSDLCGLFFAKFGVHQGSLLNPLLFVVVIDALTARLTDSYLLELHMQIILFCVVNLSKK